MANVERGVIRRVAVVVLPVLVGLSLLVPAQVSALDFTWSFFDEGFFSGTVVGLVDGVGVAATAVDITNAGSLSFFLPEDTIDGTVFPNAWTVVGGVITSVDYLSQDFDLPVTGDVLHLSNDGTGGFFGFLNDGLLGESREGTVTFSAVVGVPEPGALTLLGLGLAGLAFLARRRS